MLANTPLVSIIIPTYNRAHLIGETLESIIAQTYTNWECIVVDDGSTDTTDQLMESYLAKDSRFKYHHRPKDRLPGGNAARNYGFEVSKGEFIQWFDSDDLMHSKKIRLKVDFAISTNSHIIIDNHSINKDLIINENPTIKTFESSDFYIDYILGKKPVITNDVMLNRDIIGKLRFDEYLYKAQEYEYFSRLFEQKLKYCFINLSLSYYRESEDSISKSMFKNDSKQILSLIYLSKLLLERHKNNLLIVASAERQGRKTYKSIMLSGNIKLIFNNFSYFKNCHHKSSIIFLLFVIYNFITKSGFDVIKPKNLLL